MRWKPLPVGVDAFEELIHEQYFYIDKTLLIKDLLDIVPETPPHCSRA